MVTELLSRDNPSRRIRRPAQHADPGYAEAMRSRRSRNAAAPRQIPALSGELALIQRIRQRAGKTAGTTSELRLGIGDDCALLRPRRGEEIVVTTDLSLEGRHFRRDWHSPGAIGHRALARGLSDLAAMGARPVAAFLSMALPKAVAADTPWVEGFLDGMLTLAERTRTPLAGGDTSESPGDFVLLDIVLLGAVPQGQALRRDGAYAGDRIFVTGALGGAAAELATLPNPQPTATTSPGSHPHLYPEPRLRAGTALRQRGLATAAIDISDGLSTDLRHLCEASGLSASVTADRLPLHPWTAAQSRDEAVRLALHGGEDYELLFTVPPKAVVPRRLGGVPLTEIGVMEQPRRGGPTVRLIGLGGGTTPLQPGGWEHLR